MTKLLFDKELTACEPTAAEPSTTTTPTTASSATPVLMGQPRLRRPQRDQVELQPYSLDELLDAEHPVRTIWQAVTQLDLSQWLRHIQAIERQPGRNATDPRLLLALWIYATTRGIGSARTLAKLCSDQGELPYRWLCGNVTLNHHTLSDFRQQNATAWDQLITQIVASLMHENLVTLQRVAQDGMRVQASAGKSSFRREASLQECLQEARTQVETLKQLADTEAHTLNQAEQAARERAAREREERVQRALTNCAELQKQREITCKIASRQVTPARASTTDPEARNMKFPNGGYAPGYNVQYSTDTSAGVIVGVEVTNAGDDHELVPMLAQLQTRYGQVPREGLVDGGFANTDTIEQATAQGCTVYAPLKNAEKQLATGKNPYVPKKGDSSAVADWRQRMGTEEAKQIYQQRAQTAEWVNMFARNRGFYAMPVRGLAKCRTMAILLAVTHNLLQAAKLRSQALLTTSA